MQHGSGKSQSSFSGNKTMLGVRNLLLLFVTDIMSDIFMYMDVYILIKFKVLFAVYRKSE